MEDCPLMQTMTSGNICLRKSDGYVPPVQENQGSWPEFNVVKESLQKQNMCCECAKFTLASQEELLKTYMTGYREKG